MEIRGVVASVLNPVDALPEPWIGVHLIERDAGAQYVDEGEAFVLDPFLVEFDQLLGLAAEPTSDKVTSRSEGQGQRVEHALKVAQRRRFGFHPRLAGRRDLTGRQSVDLVVHHDVGHINVASHGLDEVIEAEAIAVSITPGRNDRY